MRIGGLINWLGSSVKLQDDTSHVVVCFKKCYPENKILLDLVSRSWLHWDKERRQWLCYYPGKKEYKNLTMLVQSSVNPSPHWKRFPVEIIKEASEFWMSFWMFRGNFPVRKVLVHKSYFQNNFEVKIMKQIFLFCNFGRL